MPQINKIHQPKEGDIVKFHYERMLGKQSDIKYAINLEPLKIHRYKNTFNAVITTTQKLDSIYPCDYLLPDGIMPRSSKAICDQPFPIEKKSVEKIIGQVNEEDLEEMRKRTAQSLGIPTPYDKTTIDEIDDELEENK